MEFCCFCDVLDNWPVAVEEQVVSAQDSKPAVSYSNKMRDFEMKDAKDHVNHKVSKLTVRGGINRGFST